MYRRGLAVLIIFASVHTVAFTQDYRKVIEVVQRMEERLTKMLAEEERARKTAVNQLRSDLTGTQPGAVQTAAPASHDAAEAGVSRDPLTRLQNGNRRFMEGRTAPRVSAYTGSASR